MTSIKQAVADGVAHPDDPYTVVGLASGAQLKVKGLWELVLTKVEHAESSDNWLIADVHRPNGKHEPMAVRASSVETVGPIDANHWPTARQTADAMLACITPNYAGSAVRG